MEEAMIILSLVTERVLGGKKKMVKPHIERKIRICDKSNIDIYLHFYEKIMQLMKNNQVVPPWSFANIPKLPWEQ